MLLWLTFERLPLSRVAERFGNLGITFRPSDIFRIFQASSPCLHVYHSWSFILLSEITSETGVVYVLLIYHACLSSYFYIPLLNLPSQTSTKFLIHGLLQYLLNRIPCQRSTLRRKNSLARHPGCRGSLTSAASWPRLGDLEAALGASLTLRRTSFIGRRLFSLLCLPFHCDRQMWGPCAAVSLSMPWLHWRR